MCHFLTILTSGLNLGIVVSHVMHAVLILDAVPSRPDGGVRARRLDIQLKCTPILVLYPR